MLRNYVIVDLETTGLRPADDRIIEVGAIRVMEGKKCRCITVWFIRADRFHL